MDSRYYFIFNSCIEPFYSFTYYTHDWSGAFFLLDVARNVERGDDFFFFLCMLTFVCCICPPEEFAPLYMPFIGDM
jgi:hypothetical protein